MAGTAKRFNQVLQKEINIHAAWLPVTNTFQLGDYGVISDGVFAKMGNIGEYGVQFDTASGNEIKLDFTSEGTKIRKLVGGAEVDALPDSDIEAKLAIEFTRAESFLLKARLSMSAMASLAKVALDLSQAPGWKKKYRVVNAMYTAQQPVVLSSREANSKVEFSGKASAIKQLDLGNVEAGLEFGSTKQLGLEVIGNEGTVGLGLFKLGFGGGPKILAVEETGEQVDVIVQEDWSADLEDDV